jgi:nitric oxide synthase oxygenase domain/subunit
MDILGTIIRVLNLKESKMSSKNQANRMVTLSNELLTKVRDAYQEIMVEKDVPAMLNRVQELDSALEKGDFVSVDYGKIIEWRNSLGCWGRTDLEKELNFHFQYYL